MPVRRPPRPAAPPPGSSRRADDAAPTDLARALGASAAPADVGGEIEPMDSRELTNVDARAALGLPIEEWSDDNAGVDADRPAVDPSEHREAFSAMASEIEEELPDLPPEPVRREAPKFKPRMFDVPRQVNWREAGLLVVLLVMVVWALATDWTGDSDVVDPPPMLAAVDDLEDGADPALEGGDDPGARRRPSMAGGAGGGHAGGPGGTARTQSPGYEGASGGPQIAPTPDIWMLPPGDPEPEIPLPPPETPPPADAPQDPPVEPVTDILTAYEKMFGVEYRKELEQSMAKAAAEHALQEASRPPEEQKPPPPAPRPPPEQADNPAPPRPHIGPRKPPANGMLTVLSKPSGAEVRVDGEPAGKTPLVIRAPAGATRVSIDVALEGYQPWRSFLQANEDGHFSTTVELEKATKKRR